MGFLACFLLYLDVIFFDTDLCPFRERESCRARNSSPGTQGLPILVCAFRELQELPFTSRSLSVRVAVPLTRRSSLPAHRAHARVRQS
jgi:hypothetical protein